MIFLRATTQPTAVTMFLLRLWILGYLTRMKPLKVLAFKSKVWYHHQNQQLEERQISDIRNNKLYPTELSGFFAVLFIA